MCALAVLFITSQEAGQGLSKAPQPLSFNQHSSTSTSHQKSVCGWDVLLVLVACVTSCGQIWKSQKRSFRSNSWYCHATQKLVRLQLMCFCPKVWYRRKSQVTHCVRLGLSGRPTAMIEPLSGRALPSARLVRNCRPLGSSHGLLQVRLGLLANRTMNKSHHGMSDVNTART